MTQVMICAGVLAVTAGCCFAQSTAAAPEFEVASVKPSQSTKQGVWTDGSPGRIRMLNMSLKDLITFAYKVKDYQVSGPAWIDSDRYDVFATLPSDAAKLPDKERWKQTLAMSRTLLESRFHLTTHRETKEMPVYGLVVDKNGAKIRELGPNPGDNVNIRIIRGSLSAERMPMSQLISILNGQLDRPVVDLTGIKGVFDIKLEWTPETNDSQTATSGEPERKPSLPVALQEQLGLKLEGRKSPVEILVVDHAEKASEN